MHAEFEAQLYHAVRGALAERPSDFAALLRALHGADPAAIVAILEEDGSHEAAVLLAEARTPRSAVAPTPRPIAHPLDYAWCFDPVTTCDLVERIATAVAPGQLVAHLGTPALHQVASTRLSDRHHVLLDRDPRQVTRANALWPGTGVQVDLLGGSLPALEASCAVMDPPWYPEHAAAFINAAARLLTPGGVAYMAFGGPLTRPGILEDCEAVIRIAAQDGLRLERREDDACSYVTPAFERAALAAAGVPGVPEVWRRGVLLTLRRTDAPAPAPRIVGDEGWEATDICGVPLRVRRSAPAVGRALLERLVPGDVLASVSRRDPRRSQVALWSSRNRVFASADPARLADVVLGLADRAGAPSSAEPAATAVARLVAVERREHGFEEDAEVPAA